jgi:hypothetical protein
MSHSTNVQFAIGDIINDNIANGVRSTIRPIRSIAKQRVI